MASDTKNVKLGPCAISYNGVDLGLTKGGVEVSVSTDTHTVEVDQFGKTPIDEVVMARKCSVKVPLAETTVENLVAIMPGASLSSDGVKAAGTVTLSGLPANNDIVTVNGVVFTFKTTSAPGPRDVLIGADASATAANLRAKLSASVDPAVEAASYGGSAGTVAVTYRTDGVVGNAFTLAKTGTNIAVSGATLSGGTNATKKKVVVTTAIGTSLLAVAKKLVLHPTANAPDDRSDDFTVPLAGTAGALTYKYDVENERVFDTTFTGYPDPTTKILFIVGDESAA